MLGARFCPSPLDKALGKTAYEARKTSQDAAASKTPISSQLEPQPRSLSCLYLHRSNRTDAGDLRILDDPLACSVNILEVCLRKDALGGIVFPVLLLHPARCECRADFYIERHSQM